MQNKMPIGKRKFLELRKRKSNTVRIPKPETQIIYKWFTCENCYFSFARRVGSHLLNKKNMFIRCDVCSYVGSTTKEAISE